MNTSSKLTMVKVLKSGFLLLMISILMTSEAQTADFFVKPDGTGTACSQAQPCALQTAIDQAVDDDAIYVSQGTYTSYSGTGLAAVVLTRDIDLYGGWDGSQSSPVNRDPESYPTIIDGEDTMGAMHIRNNIAPIVDGFTITNGKAQDGGGIYIHDASPIIRNNIITGNRTVDGGTYEDGRGAGIFAGGSSQAQITRNRILNNTAGYGGGIYHYGTEAITVTNNTISDNTASKKGGGTMSERSPDVIESNVISGNSTFTGGGIYIWAADVQVRKNQIYDNEADDGGAISMGNNSRPLIFNNLLFGNARDGVSISGSSPAIINNTIIGNGSESGNAIQMWSSTGCEPPYCTEGTLINNIIAGYYIGISGTGTISTQIDYNDVWGNSFADFVLPAGFISGGNNISENPLFMDSENGNYRLTDISPCIDAGTTTWSGGDIPETDFDGTPRPIASGMDIGAFEYGAAPDIKANGSDEAISVMAGESLNIAIALSSGSLTGENADWWLVAATPFGWYHFQVGDGSWVPDLILSHQGPLFNLGEFTVLDFGLPAGSYTFYFGVDMVMNGSLDKDRLHYDAVTVNVQ